MKVMRNKLSMLSLFIVATLFGVSSVAARAGGSTDRINAGKNATGSPSLSEMNQFAGTWKCVQTPTGAGNASYVVTGAMSANGRVFTETSAHFQRRYAISSRDGTLDMIATQDNGDFDAYALTAFAIGPFDITFTSEIPYLQAGRSSAIASTPTYEIKPYNATIYQTFQKNALGTTIEMTCTKQ
jgi:hypothetical protein